MSNMTVFTRYYIIIAPSSEYQDALQYGARKGVSFTTLLENLNEDLVILAAKKLAKVDHYDVPWIDGAEYRIVRKLVIRVEEGGSEWRKCMDQMHMQMHKALYG